MRLFSFSDLRGIGEDLNNLDRLPHTIAFVISQGDEPSIPAGVPVLILLDQTRLPSEEVYLHIVDWREAMDAIKTLKVRGAPAIGLAGAAAVALRAAEFVYAQLDGKRDEPEDFERVFVIDEQELDPDLYLIGMQYSADMIKGARPTAVNLAWGVDRCMEIVREELRTGSHPYVIFMRVFEFANELIVEDEAINRMIGAAGASLLPDGCTVLTHCNAGSLATSFYGTALGVVYAAWEAGSLERVFADETRPVCQGSRLTVWELSKVGIPVTLICDDMAASVMAQGMVDAVVVGADRIAENGDVANKIGTLGLAVLADHYGIPFYVAAPLSTVDTETPDGEHIEIEFRDQSEVLEEPIEGVDILNPAFDVTPAALVTKIITEKGIFSPSEIAGIV